MITQEQDAYNKMMAAEKAGTGYELDEKMRDQRIPEYCHKKYKMSFHTAVTLLGIGLMPGEEQELPTAIVKRINSITGADICRKYVSTVIYPRIRKHYGIKGCEDYPQIASGIARRIGAPTKKKKNLCREVCVFCNEGFTERRDGIHCICPVCSPGGPSISALSHGRNMPQNVTTAGRV